MTQTVKATSKVTKAAVICGAALCLASLAGCKPASPSRGLPTAAEKSPEPRIATDDPADAPALSPEQVPAIPPSPDPVAPIDPAEPLASLAQRYFASADPESRVELIGQVADRQDAAAVGVLGWLFRAERDTDLKLTLLAAVMMQEDHQAEQAAVLASGLWPVQPQSVRAMAVEGLAALRTPAAIRLLQSLRFDADQEIRDASRKRSRRLPRDSARSSHWTRYAAKSLAHSRSAKLLIIEDSKPLLRSLGIGLRKMGYAVDLVADGADGLDFARHSDYDVIVLDLMLPTMDGLTVLQRLRALGKKTHILILSAKDRVEDHIRGLRLGADDYMIKPFSFDELCARIQTLARRRYGEKNPEMAIHGVILNTAARFVSRDGREVVLTPAEYSIFEPLALCRGRVLSKEQLVEAIHDSESFPMPNVVEVLVCTLRKKIGCDPENPIIKTRRGYGYCIE